MSDNESDDMIDIESADKYTLPLYKSAPERIGLAIGDEPEDWMYEFDDTQEVTWFHGVEPVSVCVSYVRADIHEELEAELHEAQEGELKNALAVGQACIELREERNENEQLRAEQKHNRLVIAQHEEHLGRVLEELTEARRLLDEARRDCFVGEVAVIEIEGHGQFNVIDSPWVDVDSPLAIRPGMKLYAAPVPAQPAADVASICNAYESGVGHVGRPTAKVNPYREGSPEHEAYAIGASGTKHNGQPAAPDIGPMDILRALRDVQPSAVPEAVAKDAERYRRLVIGMFGGEHDEFIVFQNDPETGDSYPMSSDDLSEALDKLNGFPCAAILSAADDEVKK